MIIYSYPVLAAAQMILDKLSFFQMTFVLQKARKALFRTWEVFWYDA